MKKTCLFGFGLIILFFLSFLFFSYYLEKQYSINRISLNKDFDAVVVFFGDLDNSGIPDKESLRRLSFALDLYHTHKVKNIIFVGGWRPSKNISGSELMAQKAMSSGVKRENIFIDSHSRDTLQNWNGAKKIIDEKDFKDVILISSPFHLWRIHYLIKLNHSVNISYVTYDRNAVSPYKSFFENIIDFGYHAVSFALYLCMPSEFYQYLIDKIRI